MNRRTNINPCLVMTALLLGLASNALADGPTVQWQKTFGRSSFDGGESVQQTADGGYIIVGWTYPYGTADVYLIKTDSAGNSEWQKTFGGSNNDKGESVQQTADGGYIIAGSTKSFGAVGYGVYLIKTDSAGNSEWQKTFGGSSSASGESVQQTADGGYIITGRTSSYGALTDVYLMKTDSAGNSEWQKTFGGSNYDYGESVQQTYDGGYIIAGYTRSYGAGSEDVYLIKTNSGGNMQWQKTFGTDDYDLGYSVQQTTDGGYIIAGYTSSYGVGCEGVYLIKTDSAGNSEWQKTFGGSSCDGGYSVQQTFDGGYIIAGYTCSYGVDGYDVYLIKVGFDNLTATNNWDGKSITLDWPKGTGKVTLVRTDQDGSTPVEWELKTNSFTDEGIKANLTKNGQEYEPVRPGRTYKYVLKSADGSDIISNEVEVKAEVIVVLVRGFGPKDTGYWGSAGRPELEDANAWFTENGLTCWEPPQNDLGGGLSGWKSIEYNANFLDNWIDAKIQSYDPNDKPKKINLIGHSMGGLISRRYAAGYSEPKDFSVDKIFCIHTPHAGSPLAEIPGFWQVVPAARDLTPTRCLLFNLMNRDLHGSQLHSFWSDNYTDVFNAPALKVAHSVMLWDIRFLGGNDGVVPKASAQGCFWGLPMVHTNIYPNTTNYDHLSCYRHENTLQIIMDTMELPYSQTQSMQMAFAGSSDGNEANILPQYFVAGFEGQLDNNSPVTETASLTDSYTAYFRATTSDANCSFTLADPCGTIYDPCYAATEPDVNYYNEDDLLLMYEVNSPIPGVWELNLSTTIAPPNSVDYGLTVFEDANITLYSYANPDWANTDVNILISATLTENDIPVTDANLIAEITLPDTNTVSVFLYDDGLHNDVNTSDGIYANTFTSTTQVGTYGGYLVATGTLANVQFQRSGSVYFTVSAPDISFAGDINDIGIDLNANGLYDILRFTVPVDVNEPNEFLLTATLFDSNDNIIKMLTTGEVNLPAGPNTLTLEILAEDIVKHNVDGPYMLSDITLSDANTGLKIAETNDHNTASYLLSDFEALDSDGDGLSNDLELSIGTDPNLPDSDYDGLTDYQEIDYDNDANSYNPPTDLNPLNTDTDADGMSDGWELYYNFDPINDDGAKNNDDDTDGLTNLQEYQNNTDPNALDTDADGMPDGWEVSYLLNPVVYNSYNDQDQDDLTDLKEYQNNTDPNDSDTDDDGLTDGAEVYIHQTNPTNPDTDNDTILDGPDNCKLMYNSDQSDADGDGIGDTCEADISGNKEVNFLDFALMAARWLDVDCGDCGGADLDGQEDVDLADLKILTENWLEGIAN